MVKTDQNFNLPQGDDVTLDFDVDPATVEEEDQTLTGAKIEWVLCPYEGYAPGDPILSKNNIDDSDDFEILNAIAMTFRLTLSRIDSINIEPGLYYHQAKIIAESGRYYTVTKGSGIIEVSK